jgi:1,4-alpha-glucan branching enzyme
MPFAELRPEKVLGLLLTLAASVSLVVSATAADPLGATPHNDGTTKFRVWAPFVDAVAVRINGGDPIPLAREPGLCPETDPKKCADATWFGTAPAKAGDKYRLAIRLDGVTREFNDPRARLLTGFEADVAEFDTNKNQKLDKVQSVIVDPDFNVPAFAEPTFNTMVIYEMHIGTFNNTFAGAIDKLDYLKGLGINAVEVMPVTQNPLFRDHNPVDHDWGYDPVQLFAVKSKYGTPQEFKEFIKQCHQRQIAVILDVVYNHLVGNNLLNCFDGVCPPNFKNGIFFYGDNRADSGFGPRPDYGRPEVRTYIDDNALTWLREFGVDGLRWDSTVNIRAFNGGHSPIREGGQLLQQANNDFRNTDPKQPQKIAIAEDLQGSADLTAPTNKGGFGFNSQWDDNLFFDLRRAVFELHDQDRNIEKIKASIERIVGDDPFGRVIYSENHDKVGHPKDLADDKPQIRLPALIDEGNPESIFAKKRSTLAAAIMLTSPGIPMIFQGQEMLETHAFGFNEPTPVDFNRAVKFKGIVQMYHDLIALRRNLAGTTGGLTGRHLNVFHPDNGNKTLAYHRFENGGAGDDVVVVANFSNVPQPFLNIGFPRGGQWHVRFNSGAKVYDPSFENGDSFDTTANPGGRDGLPFNATVGVGPYSVVILSQ